MIFEFQAPRLVAGAGVLKKLAEELTHLRITKPLVVSDKGLVRVGHLDRVLRSLAPDSDFAVFDDVPENPTFEGAEAALKTYRDNGCDAVVALGGGSVIDTAKFVAILGTHSGKITDYVGPHSDKISDNTAPIIVIPTTAGTGSDASPDAGIHPDSTSISTGATSRYVVPRLAICDPNLTLSLPPRLTAATGLDALSHCVEGYLSKTDNPLADVMALDGMRRAWQYVKAATEKGDDLNARLQMQIAAFEGGIAIGKGLGPAHAIAISCGDQGLHHGILSALGMIASLEFLADKASAKINEIAHALELPKGIAVHDAVREKVRHLNIPTTLAGLGYKIGNLDELAMACHLSHFNATSPYVPTKEEFASMLLAIRG